MVVHYHLNDGVILPPIVMRDLYWNGKVETVMVTRTSLRTIFISNLVSGKITRNLPAVICWLAYGLALGLTVSPSPDLISTCLLLVFGLIATYGIGLIAASSVYWLNAKTGFSPLEYVMQNIFMYLVTGLSFPVAIMPFWLQIIGLCLPQTYVFDGVRRALLNPADSSPTLLIHTLLPLSPITIDLIFTLILIPPLLLLGRWTLKRSIAYARAKGILTRWV